MATDHQTPWGGVVSFSMITRASKNISSFVKVDTALCGMHEQANTWKCRAQGSSCIRLPPVNR
jgi:hypothetical protein